MTPILDTEKTDTKLMEMAAEERSARHSTEVKALGTCIIVLGMHRSGTSVVAGALSRLGVEFGKKLLAAQPYNPKGFYEHTDILSTDNEILRMLDSSYEDIKPLPENWQTSVYMEPFKEKLKDIIRQDFSEVALFGLKDPRISILLPLYLELIEEMKLDARFVICERPAMEVAMSLKERLGFSVQESFQLYEKYYEAIRKSGIGVEESDGSGPRGSDTTGSQNKEYIHKKYPAVHVRMDDFIQDPKASLERIIHALNLPLTISEEKLKDIEEFVEKDLKHHTIPHEKDLDVVVKELHDLTVEKREYQKKAEEEIEAKNAVAAHLAKLQEEYAYVLKEMRNRDERLALSEKQIQEGALLADNLAKEIKIAYDKMASIAAEALRKEQFLQQEIEAAKNDAHERVTRISHTLAHRDHRLEYLEKEIVKFEEIQQEARILQQNLISIEKSFSWKVVSRLQTFMDSIIPSYSWLRRPYETFLRMLQRSPQNTNISKRYGKINAIFGELQTLDAVSVNASRAKDYDSTTLPENFPKDIDVLFINHEESRTGAPRIVFEIAQEAMKRLSVGVISKWRGSMSEQFKTAFGDRLLHPLDIVGEGDRNIMARRMLEKIKPKLVYVNSIVSHEYAFEAKKLGIPVIFHVHEIGDSYNIAIEKEQHSRFADCADVFIAVSGVAKRNLVQKMNVPENRIRLIHEFVDGAQVREFSLEPSRTEVEEMLNIQPTDIAIVSIGTFDRRKGADIFAKVARKLSDSPSIKMIWIGRSPKYNEPLLSIYDSYRNSFIHVDEIQNPFPFLARADIFFLSSREDPFPLVVLEAMALGKPVVAFEKSGGAAEAIEGAGTLVRGFDVERAAKALKRLAASSEERVLAGKELQKRQALFERGPLVEKIIVEIRKFLV